MVVFFVISKTTLQKLKTTLLIFVKVVRANKQVDTGMFIIIVDIVDNFFPYK